MSVSSTLKIARHCRARRETFLELVEDHELDGRRRWPLVLEVLATRDEREFRKNTGLEIQAILQQIAIMVIEVEATIELGDYRIGDSVAKWFKMSFTGHAA